MQRAKSCSLDFRHPIILNRPAVMSKPSRIWPIVCDTFILRHVCLHVQVVCARGYARVRACGVPGERGVCVCTVPMSDQCEMFEMIKVHIMCARTGFQPLCE